MPRLSLPLFAKVSATARLFWPPIFASALMTVPASAQTFTDACPESASTTASDGELVVGLQLGAELNCALTAALAPWGLQIKQSDESSPGPSMPSTSVSARRISQALNARIVVWLARDSEGFALWVYDARDDHAVARPVPPPPYDGPTAAALALSVKTAVRMVGVGPEASPAEESPPEASEQVRETTKTPTPEARAVDLPEPPQRPADRTRAMTSSLVGLYTAVRVDGSDSLRWRFGGEVRLAPWGPWPDSDTQLWTGLAFELGTVRSVATERYRGEFDDIGGELALGVTQRVSDWFGLGAAASGALYAGTFSGESVARGSSAEFARINPMLLLRTEGQFRFGSVGVYLQPALGYWVQRQRFVAFGELVGETPRWSARFAAGLQLELN